MNVFNGTIDRYNGITIDTECESVVDGFAGKLKSMFLKWILQKSDFNNWRFHRFPCTLEPEINGNYLVQGANQSCTNRSNTCWGKIMSCRIILCKSNMVLLFNISCRMALTFITPKKVLLWCTNGCRLIYRQTFPFMHIQWLVLADWWWMISTKYLQSKRIVQLCRACGSCRVDTLNQVLIFHSNIPEVNFNL